MRLTNDANHKLRARNAKAKKRRESRFAPAAKRSQPLSGVAGRQRRFILCCRDGHAAELALLQAEPALGIVPRPVANEDYRRIKAQLDPQCIFGNLAAFL